MPAALAFALAVNIALVTRYIYPEWIAGGLASMGFWIGVLAWGFLVVRGIRELPTIVAPRSISKEPDRFPEARLAYLQAKYGEAEKLLNGVLAIESRDPPSLLLLAGVYRHTDRLESAERLLEEVSRLEVADGWFLELRAETKRLRDAIARASASESSESPAAGMTETAGLAA